MKRFAIYALLTSAAFTSCSKSHDNKPSTTNKCMADQMQLTATTTQDETASHIVLVNFDVKNTGTTTYDVGSGANPIYVKLSATTTSGKTYEGETPLTVTNLPPGKTASAVAYVDYGAGNVYKSYKLEEVYCK